MMGDRTMAIGTRLSTVAVVVLLLVPLAMPVRAASVVTVIVASDAPLVAAAGTDTTLPIVSRAGFRTVEVEASRADRVVADARAAGRDAWVDTARFRAALTPNDPEYPNTFGPALTGMEEIWDDGAGGVTRVIAVLDTGVDAHPDVETLLPGYSTVGPLGSHTTTATDWDSGKHGTSAALTAVGRGNNGVHSAGWCWKCHVLPVRVLDANGSGTEVDIVEGIDWAVSNGADVINLSLAACASAPLLQAAADSAEAAGVLVFAAAGNQGTPGCEDLDGDGDTRDEPTVPASFDSVIGVAGSAPGDGLYSFSHHGSWTDVAAPGCHVITSSSPPASVFCGTSAASPAAAGLAAQIWSMAPRLKMGGVRSWLRSAAVDTGVDVAHGRVDAAAMYAIATSGEPVAGRWALGDTVERPGWFDDGTWWLLRPDGSVDRHVFGQAGDRPVVGDWDGDGDDDLGVVRGNEWLLQPATELPDEIIAFQFGASDDLPLAADWDGDGIDGPGVFRPDLARFALRNSLSGGFGDIVTFFGTAGDLPVTGDWDGDGDDEVGITRGNSWRLRIGFSGGTADHIFNFGRNTDRHLALDRDGDGASGPAAVRGTRWAMNDDFDGGAATEVAYL